jgi:peptidyl-tRNA hydrolase
VEKFHKQTGKGLGKEIVSVLVEEELKSVDEEVDEEDMPDSYFKDAVTQQIIATENGDSVLFVPGARLPDLRR